MKALELGICSLFMTCLIWVSGSVAQTPLSFSLKQAQEYAYEHNYDLKNSHYDVEIAKKLVKENTAIGLPQIDGSILSKVFRKVLELCQKNHKAA